jgi:hypothetical protein
LKRLTVVELDYDIHLFAPDEIDEIGHAVYRNGIEKRLKEWKRLLIPVLEDSTSREPKFLRWKVSENHWYHGPPITDVVENGMVEVPAGTPPVV